MSNIRCTACGAPLADDAVICLKCGRVVGRRQPPRRPPQQRPSGSPAPYRDPYTQQRRPAQPQSARGGQPVPQARQQAPQQRTAPRPRPAQPRPQPRTVPRPVYDAPPPEVQAREAGGKFQRNRGVSGKLRLAARGFAAVLLITVIYICGALIQTTRVRLATYNFKSDMKMTYSSYGKAIDNYFKEGRWSANLFTGSCTYTGTNKHGEEYCMVFSAGMTIKLKSMTVDGEPVPKDLIETKVMGIFI